MEDQWYIDWSLKTIPVVIFFGLISTGTLYQTVKMQRHPDAEWKKHVKRLRTQGIDPSYIKRSPEWEASLQRQIMVGWIITILGYIFTLFLIGAIIVTIVANM